MSTGLKATPDLVNRWVTLDLSAFPEDGRPLEIWRTDENGRRRVRLPLGAMTDAGAFRVVDHEAALTGPIEYYVNGSRTNEIANSSFETNTTGWTSGGGRMTLASQSRASAKAGAKVMRATANVATTSAYVLGPTIPIKAGDKVSCNAQVSPSLADQLMGRVQWSSDNGATWTSSAAGALVQIGSQLWDKIWFSGIAPAGTNATRPIFYAGWPDGSRTYQIGDWFDVDAAVLEVNSQYDNPAYFAGTFANQGIRATTSLEDPARDDIVTVHTAAYPTTRPHAIPEQLEDWHPTRDTGAQLHWPIGRRDPIDTGGPGRLRELALTFRCADWAAAKTLESVVAPRSDDYTYGVPAAGERTIVVRQSTFPGLDTTLTVTGVDGPYPVPEDTRPRKFRLVVRGVETFTGPPILEAGV